MSESQIKLPELESKLVVHSSKNFTYNNVNICYELVYDCNIKYVHKNTRKSSCAEVYNIH